VANLIRVIMAIVGSMVSSPPPQPQLQAPSVIRGGGLVETVICA
jgi:hypothetical protein